MSTVARKLEYLFETKERIRQAIIGKGVAVPKETAFRGYGRLIEEISTGDGIKLRPRAAYSKLNAAGAVAVSATVTGVTAAAE